MPTIALIVGAGAGLRTGQPTPKAFLPLAGRPMVEHSLALFEAHPQVDGIVLMAPASMLSEAQRVASVYSKAGAVLAGGARRQDTVRIGLEALRKRAATGASSEHLVLVHDAARPLADAALVARVIGAARSHGAAIPGVEPADTVRETAAAAGGHDSVLAGRTIERSGLVLVQTPQGFHLSLLVSAYDRAGTEEVTDDAALVQRAGHPVAVVPGSAWNLKVTTAGDLELAAALLAAAALPPGAGR